MLAKLKSGRTDEIVARIQEMYEREVDKGTGELQRLNEEIKKLKILQNYYVNEFNKLLAGKPTELPGPVVREQVQTVQEKLRAAEAQKEEIESRIGRKPLDVELLKKAVLAFESWADEFDKADMPVKKTLLESIIDKVVVFDDQIEIIYNLDFEQLVLFCAGFLSFGRGPGSLRPPGRRLQGRGWLPRPRLRHRQRRGEAGRGSCPPEPGCTGFCRAAGEAPGPA